MGRLQISVKHERFRLNEVFTIARGSREFADVVTVKITSDACEGYGECVPYSRYGESIESVIHQVRGLDYEFGRDELQDLLPAGAARNAVDCALWDLEAKKAGKRFWDLAGLPEPVPQLTAFTISLASPDQMRASAQKHSAKPLLKIKLGTPDDMPRLEAVREGAPDADIIVDANEGWSADAYQELAPHLIRLGVTMVEQPLPAGDDDLLREIERPLPVCADESCHDTSSLPYLAGKYDMINIKLDKTGGLTEALKLKKEGLKQGYKIMVGCMVGSSLAMAPATLLAQGAEIVDLDGPLLLAEDRDNPLQFDNQNVYPPTRDLWG